MVESAIPDVEGSRFWKQNFNTLSEVPFEKFWKLFQAHVGYKGSKKNRSIFQEFFVVSDTGKDVPVV